MKSLLFSKSSKKPNAAPSPWEDDLILLDRDDVSDFNEENILPVSPEERAKIRKWLQPTAYSDEGSEFKKHLSSHLEDTGTWLLDAPIYKQWHSSEDDGILWIKGIPGSGKSVVAATLIDHLGNEKAPVLYFFFRQIIDANHTPQAALRDWLEQILDYSPPLQAKLAQYLKERRSLQSLAASDLWILIRTAMLYLPRAYCVVDALDEIDHGQEMLDFLEGLSKLGAWRPSKIKIVMTSRPVPSVETPLRHAPTLHLRLNEDMVDRDIATFVQHIIKTSSIEEQYHEAIKKAVPGKANGLFLYAKLAMDAFLEPGTAPEQVLENLPTDLNVMYDDLLREHTRRTGISPSLQLLIMQSVTHASRPLRLLELADMINVTQFSDDAKDLKKAKELVRTACGPLLEILPDGTKSSCFSVVVSESMLTIKKKPYPSFIIPSQSSSRALHEGQMNIIIRFWKLALLTREWLLHASHIFNVAALMTYQYRLNHPREEGADLEKIPSPCISVRSMNTVHSRHSLSMLRPTGMCMYGNRCWLALIKAKSILLLMNLSPVKISKSGNRRPT